MYDIGIDIGSTAAKAVVLEDGKLVTSVLVPTGFNSVDAAQRIADQLHKEGFDIAQARVVATGYGRISVSYATKTVTEITCHGRGAAYLFGDDLTVIDIGGQDTKVIRLSQGKVANFAMNDKCSAGTGRFLEIMADRLGVTLGDLFELAQAGQPVSISSMCTVFAESEIVSLVGAGTPREDIACGVVDSVVAKVIPLATGMGGERFALTGGLCNEPYLAARLGKALHMPVETMPFAHFAGALGAALSAEVR